MTKKTNTNWSVITGGPCTGKTTVINLLTEKGYKTTIEHARHYIDTQKVKGKTTEEIMLNKKEFQLGILKMQIKQEASLDPNEQVFLDRALPDALAYYQFLNLDFDKMVLEATNTYSYNKVFILERLPLINDYARLEDEEDQIKIHNLIIEVYESFNCSIVHVPVLTAEERVEFILENV